MRVGSVPRDDHVMPLVVVQRVVAVPLQQTRPVPQVEHVVDEAGQRERGSTSEEHVRVCRCIICMCVVAARLFLSSQAD